jgi:hypothetical protein
MKRYACLFSVVLSLVACGGSSENDDDGGTTSGGSGGTSSGSGATSSGGTSSGGEDVPLQNLPLALGEASCAKIFECCSAEEIAANEFLGEDEASCTITVAAFASFLVPPLQDAVAGGRAEYDGAALGECLALLEGFSCNEARSSNPDITAGQECPPFIVPLVDLGGDCEQSFECIGGWCDQASGSLCAPKKEDASMCSSDDECQSGYCDFADGCGAEPVETGDNLCGG